MSNAWEDMRRTKEEEYFERQNKEKIKKLGFAERLCSSDVPCSPVDAQPMDIVEIHGVRVYRCRRSGGLWLEKEAARRLLGVDHDDESSYRSWFGQIFQSLVGE